MICPHPPGHFRLILHNLFLESRSLASESENSIPSAHQIRFAFHLKPPSAFARPTFRLEWRQEHRLWHSCLNYFEILGKTKIGSKFFPKSN